MSERARKESPGELTSSAPCVSAERGRGPAWVAWVWECSVP